MQKQNIKNVEELEFAVFGIENVAKRLDIGGKKFIRSSRKIVIF